MLFSLTLFFNFVIEIVHSTSFIVHNYMTKFESLLNFLGHYKYLITIVVGLLFLGVLSESSMLKLMKLDMQKEDLQDEIEKYEKQNAESKRELDALKSNPNAVEKVARERYFMKKDNEDIFVFSNDKPVESSSEKPQTTEEE